MAQKVPSVEAPPAHPGGRKRSLLIISMGDLKDVWDAQNKICGGSNEDFARHLLMLHKVFCSYYCAANSLQKNLTAALLAVDTCHAKTSALFQSSSTPHLGDLELSCQQNPAELVSTGSKENSLPGVLCDPSPEETSLADVDLHPEESSPSEYNEHEHLSSEQLPECENSPATMDIAQDPAADELLAPPHVLDHQYTKEKRLDSDIARLGSVEKSSMPSHVDEQELAVKSLALSHIDQLPSSAEKPQGGPIVSALILNGTDWNGGVKDGCHEDPVASAPLPMDSEEEACAQDSELPSHAKPALKLVIKRTPDIPQARVMEPAVENPHVCTECGKEFYTKKGLASHMKIHKKEHRCPYCDKSYIHDSLLSAHMTSHTGEKPHKCSVCGSGFALSHQLNKHMAIHTGVKPHACSNCSKGFFSLSNLTKHLALHNADSAYLCQECGRTFTNETGLSRHMRTHTQLKTHVCTTCGKSFALQDDLTTHINFVHIGRRPHMCSACGKRFKKLATLETHHTQVHTGEKCHSCPVCNKRFCMKQTLKKHLEMHAGSRQVRMEKRHSCPVCSQGFCTKEILKNHLETHAAELSYSCAECGETFPSSATLKAHMLTHPVEKRHACLECGKKYRLATQLKAHVRLHKTDKPQTCSECGKHFIAFRYLKCHMRIHTDAMPFVCDHCGKRFRWMGCHSRHVKMKHTNERPHVCPTCGKGFTEQYDLKKHIMVHTGEKPHKCAQCSYASTNADSLRKHMKKHALVEDCLLTTVPEVSKPKAEALGHVE